MLQAERAGREDHLSEMQEQGMSLMEQLEASRESWAAQESLTKLRIMSFVVNRWRHVACATAIRNWLGNGASAAMAAQHRKTLDLFNRLAESKMQAAEGKARNDAMEGEVLALRRRVSQLEVEIETTASKPELKESDVAASLGACSAPEPIMTEAQAAFPPPPPPPPAAGAAATPPPQRRLDISDDSESESENENVNVNGEAAIPPPPPQALPSPPSPPPGQTGQNAQAEPGVLPRRPGLGEGGGTPKSSKKKKRHKVEGPPPS